MEELYTITANVLEKTAHYLEAIEKDRDDVAQQARLKVAAQIKDKFSELMGETIDEDIVSKLASADEDIIGLINKVAGSIKETESLGGPSTVNDSPSDVSNKNEQAKLAEDRFLAWLQS